MKNLHFIGLVSLMLIGIQQVKAQKNYLPAYIIDAGGDSIKGFVDYRNWGNNPDVIRFKKNPESAYVSLTPNDITEFGVKDEVYISALVDVEVSTDMMPWLDNSPSLKLKTVNTFLQVLVKGDKSLYYYKGSTSKDNFYVSVNDSIFLLAYKRYVKKHKGKDLVQENNRYKGQLIVLFENTPSLVPIINSAAYTKSDLGKLFQKYYTEHQSTVDFVKKKDKVEINYGVLAGASVTSFTYSSSKFSASFSNSTDFSAGIFMDIILTRNQGKWSINNELLYTSYHVSKSDLSIYGTTNNLVEIGYSYIKLNNMLRYKIPAGKAFIYLNAGISNGIAISETNSGRTISPAGTVETISRKFMDDTRKYEQGWLAGAGLKMNKFAFEIRHERGNGMSAYTIVNTTTRRNYLLFAYSF